MLLQNKLMKKVRMKILIVQRWRWRCLVLLPDAHMCLPEKGSGIFEVISWLRVA